MTSTPAPEPVGTQAAPASDATPAPRSCASCGAELAPAQDWCLQCGAAQPGRLGGRPGLRAAGTVAALTLALCAGAVAASYAALRDDAPPQTVASNPAPAPQTQPAPAPAPQTTPTATQTEPPAQTDEGAAAPTPNPTPTQPPTSDDHADVPAPADTDTSAQGTPSSGGSSEDDKPEETKPAPVAIELDDDAVQLYDPYNRAVAKGDPARAQDDNVDTSWFATVAGGQQQLGLGLAVDLGSKRGVKVVELRTKTPGFRVEGYATDSEKLPPDVLDTRWAHIRDVDEVGAEDGKQRIVLGGGTTKYRHVLLWFTTPPTDGPTVRITELKLLGS